MYELYEENSVWKIREHYTTNGRQGYKLLLVKE